MHFFDILHASPIPQFVIDGNHQVLYWNKALEKYSGISADEVVGTNQQWRAFYLNERPCMADLLVDQALEKLQNLYKGKYQKSGLIDDAYETIDFFPHMGKEGTWLHFTAAPIRDETGKIIGAVETLEDITDRKCAEAVLLQNEEWYRSLFEGEAEGILVTDLETHMIIHANPAICLMLGYSERELTAMEADYIHPKEYRDQIREKLMTLATGEETHTINIPCIRKDGTILNVDISTSTIIINKKVCNVGFFIDVTNRRVAEDLFQKNEEGYSALFYKNHSVSLLIDPNTAMIVDANSAACEYYGYSLKELTGKGIYDINHLPREKVIKDLIKARTEKEKHFFSTHYLAGDEKRYVEVYSGPITVHGKALFYSIIHDVTDRRRTEQALVESEERYSALFFNNYSVSLLIDPETGMIVDANPAACEYYGYSLKELTRKGIYDINHLPREKVIKDLIKARTEKEKHFFSTHYLAGDEKRYVEVYSGPITVRGKALFYSIIHDVTDRRRTEQALVESEERYSALFFNNYSVSLLIDPETGMIVDANPAACEYYGYPLEELIRKGIYEINHLPREKVIPDLIQAKTEKEKHFFSTHFRATGEKRYVEVYSGPIIVRGKVLFYSIIHDITDRRLAELALVESESRLQSIVQGSPIPKFVIDKNHRVIYWNKALEKYSSIPADEVVGTNQQWRAFYLNERPCMADLLVDGSIEKIPQWYEGKYSTSKLVDGAYEATDFFPRMGIEGKWLYFTAAPIYDSTGRIIGAVETLEDITERKLAEKALRESEVLLNDIVRGSPIPQFVVNQSHHVVYWNEALEICSGVLADEVVGTNQQWRAFYLNERPCMADLLVDGSIEKIPQWYEGKYSTSKLVDGAYEATDFFPRMGIEGKWLYFTAAPIYDSMGRIIGAVETLEDITERKLAEKALRESEVLLNDIVRGSPIPQFVVNQNHHVVYWNEALEICSGVLADEVVGTNQQWRAFYLNERPCMADLLVDGSIEKIPQWYEGKYSTSKLVDGAYEATDFFPRMGIEGKWLYFTAAPIKDETGRIIGAVETLEDITERKLAEKALRESEALLNDIVRGSPIPQFVVDQNHYIVYWNEALEICSGMLADEVVGTNQQWRAFYLNERPCMADLLVDGSIEKIQQWYEGKYSTSKLVDGAYEATDFFPRMGIEGKWLYFTAAPIKDETGRIIGAVETLEDITAQKKATEKLAKKAEELARSNTELEQFAYIASHDLQEPLRMIGSYLQLIERRYKGRLDSDADEFIAYAVDGAQRLKNMINGLLEFSRVQTRGLPFQPVSAEKILAGSLLNMKMSIDETCAIITHDPLPTVLVDLDQLIRVLQNLINNAIKFRGENPPQIHISARQEGDFWIFSVKDNGMGFEEKYRDQLFILFRRLQGSAYPGTGIGLAVCKRIIERHGGKIWAESQPGAGSTFFFTIPVRGESSYE